MPPLFEHHRQHLEFMRLAALRAVDPAAAVRRSLIPRDLADAGQVFVVGAGKAAAAMTQAVAEIAGRRLTAGVVSVPFLPANAPDGITFIVGGHPTPTAASLYAGRAIADLLKNTTERDLVIAVISGGGSALLELPYPGIGLEDLQTTTKVLLECGATIHEINRVRTCLSQIKGGGLARLAWPARVIGLILSDVVGNDLGLVASGPTVPSRKLHPQAAAVIRKYGLAGKLPATVKQFLQTPPPCVSETINPAVENRLIASNRQASLAATAAARGLGFAAEFLGDEWQGEARTVGRRWAGLLHGRRSKRPLCLIAGGETTVTVRGQGLGGRNQEVTLAAALVIAGRPRTVVSAFATDGVDGPTDAAGAVATGESVERARRLGLEPRHHLAENNAYAFFAALGDLIVTGPSGTNVNDLLFGMAY